MDIDLRSENYNQRDKVKLLRVDCIQIKNDTGIHCNECHHLKWFNDKYGWTCADTGIELEEI
jgi:hypothetical protein